MKLRNKKTGEIVERSSIVTLRYKISSSSSSLVEAEEFSSIGQLNEEWEDYKPLIKDEKIRKAVRAWSEANKATTIRCYQNARTCDFSCENLELDAYTNISFFGDGIIDKSLNNNFYTIEELCGEEE